MSFIFDSFWCWLVSGLVLIAAEVVISGVYLLWLGLGAPKQELWMAKMSPILDVPVMIGVGAAFDYLAGTKRAAPRR